MERYLEGQELSTEEVAKALKEAVTRGEVFPVACGVASKNLGTTAVLDLLVEGVPSPAKKGAPISVDGGGTAAFVFKTIADPFAGRINVFRVLNGTLKGDSTIVNGRSHAKERLGQLMELQGKEHVQVSEFGEGDIGAVAKLKETQTGDVLLDAERQVELPDIGFPEPVMSFAVTPKAKGDEEKMAAGSAPARRGGSDDPDASRSADRRAAADRALADPRRGCRRPAEEPVQRRGRAAPAAGSLPGDDPQGSARAGPLQEADRRARSVRRLRDRPRAAGRPPGLRVRRQDRRRRDSPELPPRGRQGHPGGDGARRARRGAGAGSARRPRRRLVPHRRLLGDGVQDRRLDGVQVGVREGRPGACSSRSWSSR